jgi:hypothetical protein
LQKIFAMCVRRDCRILLGDEPLLLDKPRKVGFVFLQPGSADIFKAAGWFYLWDGKIIDEAVVVPTDDIAAWLDILIEALEAVTCADGDVVWTNGTEYTWSVAMRGRQLYSRCSRKAVMRARIAASDVNTEIKPLKALQPTSSKPSAMFAGR